MSNEENEVELPGYTAALNEVQEILTVLESNATDVDLLADRVRRADVLLRHCRARLDDARFRVEQVVTAHDDKPANINRD